ncbi:MAG TPA: XRE family transcriptional regulator, partial [Mycobacterium sp.]|nr:XRE family transcriptional regulator [Mycobacterium sp.]
HARIHAKLTAQEAAYGVGLSPDLPDELEAGGTPTDKETPLVQQLIAAIRTVAGLQDVDYPPPPVEEHVNGLDEALAVNGAGEEANAAAH